MIFPSRSQLIRDLSLTRTDQMEISKRRGDPHRLERVNKEIRRRTRVVGIFPNEASVLRLTSAVLAEIHEEWLTGRQYLNLADWSTTEKPASQINYRKSVA